MLKTLGVVVVLIGLLGGGVYLILQPVPLLVPVLSANPSGVAQSTLNDVRIRDPRWLSKDGNSCWVACRFGESDRIRTFLLVDLENKETTAMLRSGVLVCWINDREILVYNQGRTDSKLKQWMHILHPESPITRITQFFVIDAASGVGRKICEIASTNNLNAIQVSRDGARAVGCWGPEELYEFGLQADSEPRKIDEPYVWAPMWIDEASYLFVGETAIHQREFGADRSKRLSQPLLQEVRDAVSQYGAPTVKICGKQGENLFLHDHSPVESFDRLMVVDPTTSLVQVVARMVPSSELPRFNQDGTMMVYQGQQFDRNMDTVYLQTIEVDSQPVELVTGEFGGIQESTPLFRREDVVLYVHRGIELRSISLASGETELHWPIAVVPN